MCLVACTLENSGLSRGNSLSMYLGFKGSEWDFGVFSGLVGVEKPDPMIYKIALEKAGNVAPKEALHIGDSMRKDYLPARSVGMHALLLDRFKTPDAETWRKSDAPVLTDLVAVQDWITKEEEVVADQKMVHPLP